ncbi:hypothetical protein V1527DRAFT_183259 [Lipomyces starkeyi]
MINTYIVPAIYLSVSTVYGDGRVVVLSPVAKCSIYAAESDNFEGDKGINYREAVSNNLTIILGIRPTIMQKNLCMIWGLNDALSHVSLRLHPPLNSVTATVHFKTLPGKKKICCNKKKRGTPLQGLEPWTFRYLISCSPRFT